MKYSICGDLMLCEYDHRKRFSITAQNGFQYYEFWTWQDKDIKLYRALCDEFDIKISAFSGDDAFSMIACDESEAYLDFFNCSLECAEYLGTGTLIVHSDALIPGERGIMPAKLQSKEMCDLEKMQACVRMLKGMALLAEKKNVNIAFEPLNTKLDHPGYYANSMQIALNIVQKVSSKRVKILYDIYHMQIMEGNIIGTLTDNIDSIGYIHIADVPGRYEPGTGELNYPNILKTLDALGYTGFVGIECKLNKDMNSVTQMLKNFSNGMI